MCIQKCFDNTNICFVSCVDVLQVKFFGLQLTLIVTQKN